MERERLSERARLRAMMVIRRFEERVVERHRAGRLRGCVAQRVGAEAVAVGLMRALDPDDAVVSPQGEHAHALARGIVPSRVAAEVCAWGDVRGRRRHRGGAGLPFDARTSFFCNHAIVAGGVALAVGLALADEMLDRRRVTACRFGEGSVAAREFHEAMNLASLWRLPVVFLCENQVYARGSALARVVSHPGLCATARRYAVRAERVDAFDAGAVEQAVRSVAGAAREGCGPGFVELTMYQVRARSMLDAELARDLCEADGWTLRDPIAALTERLRNGAIRFEEDLARMEVEVADEVDAAVSSAERVAVRT